MPKVKFKARTTAEIENLDIENGSLIYNTENGKTYLDYDNERISTGGGAGGGVATGDTPPENPEENDLWVDTNDEEHLAQVDNEVSSTSTNAIQNQAITNYVNDIAKGTLLWTNSSPTSNFAAQDINLNSGDYEFYEIIWKRTKSQTYFFSTGKLPKGSGTVMFVWVGEESGSTLAMRYRYIDYSSDTKLVAETGYTKVVNSTNVTTQTDSCIPVYVIGYKTGLIS